MSMANPDEDEDLDEGLEPDEDNEASADGEATTGQAGSPQIRGRSASNDNIVNK